MNIAICDDCARDIKSLEERILKVVDPETIKKFYEFHSGKDLLDHYTKFDIIFLDIRMEGGISGRQAAKMIHSQDPDALISFYTAYDYPSSRIVNVHPFSYIMKDLAEDKIKEMLRLIFKDFEEKTYEEIQKRYGEHILQADTDDIIEQEVRFFVWARPMDWVFSVVPVYRKDGKLYLGKEEEFYFENDGWVQNFFDGLK